jgi:hypothetical protein
MPFESLHSDRKASVGLMASALRAGTRDASTATERRRIDTPRTTSEPRQCVREPQNSPLRKRIISGLANNGGDPGRPNQDDSME